MTAVAALAAALAVALTGWRPGPARLRAVLATPADVGRSAGARQGIARPAWGGFVMAGVGALAVAMVVGGANGLVLGAATLGIAGRRVLGPPASSPVDEATALRAGPLLCDLMAATLLAGAPIGTALQTVSAAVPPSVGALLTDVAASLALGAPVEEAWTPLERAPPLRPLARAAVRSTASGAALAATLTELSDELRESALSAGQAAARRAGVRVVGPLTLCFLPAFVLTGVVPLVYGLLPALGR